MSKPDLPSGNLLHSYGNGYVKIDDVYMMIYIVNILISHGYVKNHHRRMIPRCFPKIGA
jgi:hypothetical protein